MCEKQGFITFEIKSYFSFAEKILPKATVRFNKFDKDLMLNLKKAKHK